jgi:hypothetical protein
VLFVDFTAASADGHTLMAQIVDLAGPLVDRLSVLRIGAAAAWEQMRDEPGEVPMPLSEVPVAEALADLAGALRHTDMLWPRHDDEHFVELRALAWARSRPFLPDWPEFEPTPDGERANLIEAFVAEAGPVDGDTDGSVTESLADLFLDYGDAYLHARPLGWSPSAVALFLNDWLPRKAILDPAQRAALPEVLRRWLWFAGARRGVPAEWTAPVLAAVDEHLPQFAASVDDADSWGPAKEIVAELAARGVDLTDRDAVDRAMRALNAERLTRRLSDS